MEQKKPSFPEQFPTSARPVYLRYGLLTLVLAAIFLYLYFEGKEPAPAKEPNPLDLINQSSSTAATPAPEEEVIKLTD